MLKITETLIINGVVIANGVPDSDNDILDKKDIKTIFMKYQRDTDTMHTNIKNDGVEVFASWISEIDGVIGGKPVPAGSWMATLKITNPQLIKCIEQGKLNGFSLGSVSEKAMTPKYWFINKSLNYRDIKDIEEVIPLFISIVDKPANQYGFEVMTYDAYINKNVKDVEEMTDVENKEEMISVSALERIKGLFVTKSEEEPKEEEEEIKKEETEPVTSDSSADDQVNELFAKLDTIIEQNNQILEAINKEDTVDEEEEIEKEEDDEKKEEATEEESTASEEKKDEEVEKAEDESSEEEKKKDEDVSVEKRQTNMIENQIITDNTTFYQNTGRDSLGRKIRH